jgi:hypothetical protein
VIFLKPTVATSVTTKKNAKRPVPFARKKTRAPNAPPVGTAIQEIL